MLSFIPVEPPVSDPSGGNPGGLCDGEAADVEVYKY